ncbi:hypothetical protein NQ176_g10318 [Zarea fungicola]|uniref:Uncharacterized protein n=1 Tax=Zarea fungicola TaxID=93591 RepID=A0ACC1MGD0_9HYPO|nr:hypothetical protein NQ176_g10318 [Lecanicillium fungicola]
MATTDLAFAPAGESSKQTRSSPYDDNFETIIVEYNIFMELYQFPDDRAAPQPINLEQIVEFLSRPRKCPSLSAVSPSDFFNFRRASWIEAEGTVMATAVKMVAGPSTMSECNNVTFSNLGSMTEKKTTQPKPDLFDGACFGDVDVAIRKELSAVIMPTELATVPVVPNFFLEVKSCKGSPRVAKREACWDGAHGARAMHALQNFGRNTIQGDGHGDGYGEVFDGNAYTFSATFCAGILEMFAHFVTRASDGRREYHMTMLRGFNMHNSIDSFVQGASMLRNARDLAKLYRDAAIKAANGRAGAGS